MEREVLLEKTIFDTFLTSRSDGNSYGILIGQNSPECKVDHIFLPLETPVHENSNEQNSDWIAKHALSVYRMLPGTFYVRGFYVFQDAECFQNHREQLMTITSSVYHQQASIEDPLLCAMPTNQYVLLIHPSTKDLQCYSVQCTGADSDFQPVTVRCKPFIDRWIKLSTRINIVLDTTLPKERTKEKILKEFQMAARPILTKVKHNSCLLVNGESLSLDEPVLSPCASEDSSGYEPQKSKSTAYINRRGSLGADSGAGDDAASAISGESILSSHYLPQPHLSLVGFEMPDLGYTSSEEEEEAPGPITHLCVQGRVPALTFLPENSSVRTVQQALQDDIIRSVHTRLDLLTDELQVMGGELHSSHLLLPQRVLINLPTCPRLPLSDYKFLSETTEDVVSRVRFLCRTTSRSVQLRAMADTACGMESPIRGLVHDHSSSGRDTPTSVASGETDVASEIDEHCIDHGLEVTASAVSDELATKVGVIEDIEKVTTKVANNRWRIISIISLTVLLLSILLYGLISLRSN